VQIVEELGMRPITGISKEDPWSYWEERLLVDVWDNFKEAKDRVAAFSVSSF